MDCVKLFETSNIFGYNGVCIGAEKSLLLHNSLLLLQQENHFRKAFYWGRINGVRDDYHIAYGYEKDVLSGQAYFYSFCADSTEAWELRFQPSQNSLVEGAAITRSELCAVLSLSYNKLSSSSLDAATWLLMPKANKCSRFLAPLAVTAFQGDPAVVTNIHNADPSFDPVFNEDYTQHLDGPIPKELREEDRLAAIVDLINEDAMIIPRGGWFKRPTGDIVENLGFEGLTATEAADLKSYQHARPPQHKWNTNLLTRPDYNYAIDFLDTIDTDVPKGCWNLQLHQGGHLAVLQSLYWPGMTFYHKVNSPHYGALYVGHGMKNLDVPFAM